MDSFEFNKIAGGVLAALLLAFGGGTLAEIFQGGHDSHAKPGYVLPVVAAVSTGSSEAAGSAFKFEAVANALKTASAESGQGVFKKCAACHTAEKDGKPGTGPNLWGVVGRNMASSTAFTRYSGALKGAQGVWSWDKIAAYIYDPRTAIPGNQMAFAGVKNTEELADLLAYMRSLSDKPVALPN